MILMTVLMEQCILVVWNTLQSIDGYVNDEEVLFDLLYKDNKSDGHKLSNNKVVQTPKFFWMIFLNRCCVQVII